MGLLSSLVFTWANLADIYFSSHILMSLSFVELLYQSRFSLNCSLLWLLFWISASCFLPSTLEINSLDKNTLPFFSLLLRHAIRSVLSGLLVNTTKYIYENLKKSDTRKEQNRKHGERRSRKESQRRRSRPSRRRILWRCWFILRGLLQEDKGAAASINFMVEVQFSKTQTVILIMDIRLLYFHDEHSYSQAGWWEMQL